MNTAACKGGTKPGAASKSCEATSVTAPCVVLPSPQLISAMKSAAVSAGLPSMNAATGMLVSATSGMSGGSGTSPRMFGSVSASPSVAGMVVSRPILSLVTPKKPWKKGPSRSATAP